MDSGYDGYIFEDSSSSDEESCHLAENDKNKHELGCDNDSESEDEFEKEMRDELDDAMDKFEQDHFDGSVMPKIEEPKGPEACYSKEYFDSDSDEEYSREEKGNQSHPVLSNDDLLYDPDMDDMDEIWVDTQRRKYQPKDSNGLLHSQALPTSDAVLNCPGCMTQLCLDCQRHAVYKSQYRAMFVTNCKVATDEIIRCPLKGGQKKSKKNTEAQMDIDGSEPDDVFHPVYCNVCNTEVAAIDKEEVFHFYKIIASHS